MASYKNPPLWGEGSRGQLCPENWPLLLGLHWSSWTGSLGFRPPNSCGKGEGPHPVLQSSARAPRGLQPRDASGLGKGCVLFWAEIANMSLCVYFFLFPTSFFHMRHLGLEKVPILTLLEISKTGEERPLSARGREALLGPRILLGRQRRRRPRTRAGTAAGGRGPEAAQRGLCSCPSPVSGTFSDFSKSVGSLPSLCRLPAFELRSRVCLAGTPGCSTQGGSWRKCWLPVWTKRG